MIVPAVGGTVGTGSTSVTPGTPAGMITLQEVLEIVVAKPATSTINTPASWTSRANHSGGSGVQGTDEGPSRAAIFSRAKDTSWSAPPAVSVTGGNSAAAVAIPMYPASGSVLAYAATQGVYDPGGTGGVNWNAVMDSDPGIQADDRLIIVCANQSDGPTWSNQALSVPGCTLTPVFERTEALEGITGQDVGGMICEFMVKSGSSTGVATFTATCTANSTGPTILLRLRETSVPNNLIHGVEPEAAGGFVGPIVDGNGNLYRVTEEHLAPGAACPEFGNHPMMMKSTDNGVTWKRMDSANGPGYAQAGSFNDMESASMVLRPGRQEIELCYMKSESRWWGCTYRTSDHPTDPDTWLTSSIGTSAGVETFPATVASESAIACCALTDGTVRAFIRGQVQGGFQAISHRVKATTTWAAGTYITKASSNIMRPQCVVDPTNDLTYLFVRDDTNGQVSYCTITAAGTVSGWTRVDSGGAGASGSANYANNVVPPVYYDDGGTPVVVVAFVNASNRLRTVEVRGGVVQAEQEVSTNVLTVNPPDLGGSSTDNMGPSAAIAVLGTTLYAFWGEVIGTSGDVYYASRPNGGSWSARTLLVDTGTGRECQWIYANALSASKIGLSVDFGRHVDDDSNIFYAELTTGTSYNKTPADNVGITDALVLERSTAFADNVGVTDSAVVVQDNVRTVADAVGITDSISAGFLFDRTPADPVGITDAVTIEIGRLLADSVGVTDAATHVQDMVRSTNDPVGITDLIALGRGLNLADSVGITDSLTSSVGYIISLSDTVGITDAATQIADIVRNIGDSVGITDTSTVVNDLVRAVVDNVGITDTVTKVTDQSVTVADNVGILDTATADLIGSGAASIDDPVGITDLAAAVQDILRSQNDAVGITDAVSVAIGRTLNDNVAITDNVVIVMSRNVLIADAIGITDNVTAPPPGSVDVVLSVVVGGVKKTVTSASVVVGGVKKTVTSISIIIGGVKNP